MSDGSKFAKSSKKPPKMEEVDLEIFKAILESSEKESEVHRCNEPQFIDPMKLLTMMEMQHPDAAKIIHQKAKVKPKKRKPKQGPSGCGSSSVIVPNSKPTVAVRMPNLQCDVAKQKSSGSVKSIKSVANTTSSCHLYDDESFEACEEEDGFCDSEPLQHIAGDLVVPQPTAGAKGEVSVADSMIQHLLNVSEINTLNVHIAGDNTQVLSAGGRQCQGTIDAPSKSWGVPFDGYALATYMQEQSFGYDDMFGNERPITDLMYEMTPRVIVSSFRDLNSRSAEVGSTTRISDLFPSERGLTAIIGEPGSGKTVYLKTLTSYLVKVQSLMVFEINFTSLSQVPSDEVMKFGDLLKRSCSGYAFDCEDDFGLWLVNNQHRCAFVCDGFDQPGRLDSQVPLVNLESRTSALSWMSLLLARRIMRDSQVIIGSRPSALLRLSILHRPTRVLALHGFHDDHLLPIIATYNPDQAGEIHGYLTEREPALRELARNPFVLAVTSLMFDEVIRGTECAMYTIIFDQLRRSTHNHQRVLARKDGERWSDELLYTLHSRLDRSDCAFTEHELLLSGKVELEDLENHSMIAVRTTQQSNLIERKDKFVQPLYKILMDYQVARHMVRGLDNEAFTNMIEEKMFNDLRSEGGEDRWFMIRRFVCGLVCTDMCDEIKRLTFVNKFGEELFMVVCVSSFYRYHAFADQTFNTQKFEIYEKHHCRLMNDLLEMSDYDISRSVKFSFDEAEQDVQVETRIEHPDSLRGVCRFLLLINPKLKHIVLRFDTQLLTAAHIGELANAVKSLKKKVNSICLIGLPDLDDSHTDSIEKMVTRTSGMIGLQYEDHVTPETVKRFRDKFQAILNENNKVKSTWINVDHQGFVIPIRHQIYFSPEANSAIQTSNLSPETGKTINLVVCSKRKDFLTNIYDMTLNKKDERRNDVYDFICESKTEFEVLLRILTDVKTIKIGRIRLCLPTLADKKLFHGLARIINRNRFKFESLYVFNLNPKLHYYNEIRFFFSNVRFAILLYVSGECDDDSRFQYFKIDRFRPKNPRVHLQIHFTNLILDFPPLEQAKAEFIFPKRTGGSNTDSNVLTVVRPNKSGREATSPKKILLTANGSAESDTSRSAPRRRTTVSRQAKR